MISAPVATRNTLSRRIFFEGIGFSIHGNLDWANLTANWRTRKQPCISRRDLDTLELLELFLSLREVGPTEHNSDLRWILAFGACHHEGLAIGGDIVSRNRPTPIELAVEQFDRILRPEDWLNLHRHAHHFGSVPVNDFLAAAHPTRLLTAIA